MLVDVVKATPTGDVVVDLVFSDNTCGSVDVSRLVSFTGVFAPLTDPAYFRLVGIDKELGTIVWPNGADLDPQVLHRAAADARQTRTPGHGR